MIRAGSGVSGAGSRWLAAGCGLALAAAAAAQHVHQAPEPGQAQEIVHYCTPDAEGRLSGGRAVLPRVVLADVAPLDAHAVTLWDPDAGAIDGAPPERLDIVIVGDGYQAHELGLYAQHADDTAAALLSQEPFRTYSAYFRIHRVDVISQDSGVDHDPVYGIYRNTALDMEFWCNGIERLLCANVSKVYQYARSAPHQPDQVLAIANSSKYGGAGYTSSNLATVAGGNGWAAEVAVHEFGHSIGNLADEYDYGGDPVWRGPEVSDPNASIYTSAEMLSQSRKWFRWLGVSEPAWDGLVSTFEGCRYHQQGIYRPTNNSKMRSLGRPFNLPSAEALIVEFYRVVRPIDDATPVSAALTGSEVVFVQPVEPLGRPLDVQWFLNDEPIPGATATTLDLTTVALSPGLHELKATVVDNTPWVQNPSYRDALLTESRLWAIDIACYADCDGSGELDFFDFLCFQNAFAAGDPLADCDASGSLDFFDFLCFQNEFAAGCP